MARIHVVLVVIVVVMIPLASNWGFLGFPGGIPAAMADEPTVESAGVASGGCVVNKVRFKTSDVGPVTTTSTTYVDVPDMSVSLTVSGTTNTCLKVEFSAVVFATVGFIALRAVRDGTIAGLPAEVVPFSADDDENGDGRSPRVRAFNFAFKGVTPGAHTVKMQWHSAGPSVGMEERSMFVHYK